MSGRLVPSWASLKKSIWLKSLLFLSCVVGYNDCFVRPTFHFVQLYHSVIQNMTLIRVADLLFFYYNFSKVSIVIVCIFSKF